MLSSIDSLLSPAVGSNIPRKSLHAREPVHDTFYDTLARLWQVGVERLKSAPLLREQNRRGTLHNVECHTLMTRVQLESNHDAFFEVLHEALSQRCILHEQSLDLFGLAEQLESLHYFEANPWMHRVHTGTLAQQMHEASICREPSRDDLCTVAIGCLERLQATLNIVVSGNVSLCGLMNAQHLLVGERVEGEINEGSLEDEFQSICQTSSIPLQVFVRSSDCMWDKTQNMTRESKCTC
mmetsp:Transcript_3912/g.14803  ORF Transcript_3912/g.14803 Transcript_3912/m.14803 type:complete len:239 (+) Transcript_3912:233-949(+)